MAKNCEIAKRIEIIDLCLYLKKEDSLIIADLHLGLEGSMNKDGVLIPRFNLNEIKKRLEEKVFSRKKHFSRIIINGDLKHEFGKPSKQEWPEAAEILSFLKKYCDGIILIKGNHDNILPFANSEKIKILNELYIPSEKLLILHGHRLSESGNFKKAKTLIIAHDHPAITISEGAKKETFKCFLRGKFGRKTLIVQPSLSMVSYGTNVLSGNLLSPFLKGDLSAFEAWVVEDRTYYFGKISALQP